MIRGDPIAAGRDEIRSGCRRVLRAMSIDAYDTVRARSSSSAPSRRSRPAGSAKPAP
jgi:hypothetical protein